MGKTRAFKKGDRVMVTSHKYDSTPTGKKNDAYGYGATGVIVAFRNNRFEDVKQATVELDSNPGDFVDWSVNMIAHFEDEA